eukprot:scaffold6238_cov106-Cylindrotheca_fusiformis.AAC.1
MHQTLLENLKFEDCSAGGRVLHTYMCVSYLPASLSSVGKVVSYIHSNRKVKSKAWRIHVIDTIPTDRPIMRSAAL